ncbi:Crp/Fnr family transcriptional regulator [Lacticaseibacillus jixiensis]|uniref:Crp/Fnr family transcriptional regulator n=1 Tax=Lacticaseibacillus jixiensis TaxID=3231926 RepID=UPI0036F3B8DF
MQISDYYAQIKATGHRRTYRAGDDLLQEGDVATQLYFVESGALRLWHNADGRDVTVQLFFENQAVASFESFYLTQPSLFTITAIEPTTVISVDGSRLRQALQDQPAVMAAFTDYVCHRFIDYTQYFLNRIEESPEARYRSLLANDPKLIARVPKYELATYLGITPVSLSRIRERVRKSSPA